MSHKMREISPELGLHGIVDHGFQRTFLAEQCMDVLQHLDVLLDKTTVPGRRQDFLLDVVHDKTRVPSHLEAKLERAIWCYTRNSQNVAGLRERCVRIHSYQVPLTAHSEYMGLNQSNEGWAEFDLMGTNHEGFPVVLELKTDAPQSSNPLHMTIEAAKYGVALKQMWPHMLKEWKEAFGDNAPKPPLKTCQLIGIAPDKYWTYWFGNKRQARLWEPLNSLGTRLAKHGLPISFASFEYKLVDADLPKISKLQLIDLPV